MQAGVCICADIFLISQTRIKMVFFDPLTITHLFTRLCGHNFSNFSVIFKIVLGAQFSVHIFYAPQVISIYRFLI